MEYKVVIVGDAGVGKTAFVHSLFKHEFEPNYIPTLGVEISYFDFENIRFNIWDTAGQEKNKGLRSGYFVNADCAIVMVSDNLTTKLIDHYKTEIRKECGDIPIVVVCNKCDLYDRFPRFTNDLLVCSSKLGLYVEEPFHKLIRKLR